MSAKANSEYGGADHTPFAQIPDWVFAHPDVRSGSVLSTYIAMYLDANWKKRESVVDWRSIADRTGLSRTTIFDNIRTMDKKVIVRRGRGRYWLPIDKPAKSEIPDYGLDAKSEIPDLDPDSKSDSKSDSSETPLLTDIQRETNVSSNLDAVTERLAQRLADRIEANGSVRPEVTEKWLGDLDALIVGGRSSEEISRLIDWCQNDKFWHQHINSPSKLRQKYDRLRLQAFPNGAPAAPSDAVDQEIINKTRHDESVAPPRDMFSSIRDGLLKAEPVPVLPLVIS